MVEVRHQITKKVRHQITKKMLAKDITDLMCFCNCNSLVNLKVTSS